MASENITLYIKGDRNVEVTEQDVFLKDIVSMECSDKKFLPKLQTVKILKLHGNREQRYVVSVLEIGTDRYQRRNGCCRRCVLLYCGTGSDL